MGRRSAWVLTLVYMLVAGAWIVASDTLLSTLDLSAEQFSSLSLVKGIGFVVVTGAVLFLASSHTGRKFATLNERLSATIDVSPVPLITLDLDGNVTMWNPAAERVFGWSEREVLGKPNPVVPDEALGESGDIQKRIMSGEIVPGIELTSVTKDGQRLLVRVFTASVHDDRGAVVGLMGVIEDITQRRAARLELEQYRDHLEELVEERTVELQLSNDALTHATEAKDTFLASMSHELRTPLNSIIGFSGIMLQGLAGPLNEEQQKQLGMVNSAGHHLLALINDVLDLVKIEAGQTASKFESVRVSDVLDSVRGIMAPLADERGVELTTAGGEDVTLVSDRRRLEQILLNLISNAIKFTPKGSVTVLASSDSGVVRFEVADTGVGIPDDALESIFDEFTQIDRADRVRPEGTGLGLAISRRLATLLGGRVSASSRLGSGSVFVLELPLTRLIPESPTGGEPVLGQCSVLVVDDDSHTRDIVSVVLKAAGYRVLEAPDGEVALSIVARERPDAIVLDLVMPRLDGWAVHVRLRGDPAMAAIPVICISVIDEEDNGIENEFAGYMVKPIDPAALVTMLDSVLAGANCAKDPGNQVVT